MFIGDLFNKKTITESLRPGEYYTFKVFFDDGSDETLNFSSDDIDWDRVGAKRGKRVVDVKRQGGIQGSQSDGPRKPHDFPDDRGLARAQRAYDRQMPEGVAEGISVVDQDYDLDQMTVTLDIEGQIKHFTYWDYDENFANAERRDVFDQLQEQPWYAGLDHPTKMEILDAAYRAIRGIEPGEYRPTVGDEPLDEAGPFSYGARKPRRGSVADLAAKKRREQERGRQPTEPRDQMVGVAKVLPKDVAEGFDELDAYMAAKRAPKPKGGAGVKHGVYGTPERKRGRGRGPTGGSGSAVPSNRDFGRPRSVPRAAPMGIDDYDANYRREVDEGSVQDKLHRHHQELRKKSGLPDPDYYKELKATYDLPDAERYAKAAELKKKYRVKESTVTKEDRERYLEEMHRAGYEIVTEAATLCPECGGPAYSNQMLAEKQDACYHKVKSRYKVWPSAYASGALVRCRKVGAKNWGNKSKK